MKTKLLFLFSLTLSIVTAQNTYEFDWGFSSTNQQISIDVGDTVTWTWTGGTHNLRSFTGGAESFDSGYSGATGFTFSHTFTVVGQTDYVCDPHAQSMYGTVTVNAPAQSFSAGDVVVTEIMQNPAGVSDNYGEWFEVYNTTSSDIDLNGWTITDQAGSSQNIANIESSVIVPSGGYITMGRGGDTDVASANYNGGITHAFVYDAGFLLSNGADEVILVDPSGTIIDEVYYDGGSVFPDPTGSSMQLDPGFLDASNNDTGSNWCESVDSYGTVGDLGTPASSNPTCAPTCEAALAAHDAACDESTSDIDTYTVNLGYYGAGTSTFVVSSTAGTVGGDDPSITESGTITILGVPEGTNVTISVDDTANGGLCSLTREVTSPVCIPTGVVDLELQGVIDFTVPTAGNDGKAVHVVATGDIEDLSIYGIGIAGNGLGSDGQEYTFDAISVNAGDHILVARTPSAMESYFTTPGYQLFDHVLLANSDINSNGNDAVELFKNGAVVETFGEIFFDGGSGNFSMEWAFQDSWAYKNTLGSSWPNDWIYGGQQCTDDSATTFDSSCVYPFVAALSTSDLTVNKISVFPNPVSNGIVNIKSQNLGDVNVKLYDIMGRCVLSTKINSEILDVSSVGPGVYLLQVSVGDSSNTTKLVIR